MTDLQNDTGVDEDQAMAKPSAHQNTASVGDQAMAGAEALLPPDAAERYRSDWEEVQGGFVDEPRNAVERADRLVEDVMQRLSASFANERARLEEQWDSGDDVSTEDLRVALTRYRSFFERLLAA